MPEFIFLRTQFGAVATLFYLPFPLSSFVFVFKLNENDFFSATESLMVECTNYAILDTGLILSCRHRRQIENRMSSSYHTDMKNEDLKIFFI